MTKTLTLSARAVAAEQLARNLLAVHGLHDWSFAFNRSKTNMGLCRYGACTIELSLHFVERNAAEVICDTLLHEIAHALAGQAAGHGTLWRAICLRIGARPARLSFDCDMPEGRWQATCGGCGRLHHRHRRPKQMKGWFCSSCGQQRGQLAWTHT
jgi:predicted SprT family Zn-dependent metalloprotease